MKKQIGKTVKRHRGRMKEVKKLLLEMPAFDIIKT